MKPVKCQKPSQKVINDGYKETRIFVLQMSKYYKNIYLLGSSDQFEPSPFPLVVLVVGSLNKSFPVGLGVKVGH